MQINSGMVNIPESQSFHLRKQRKLKLRITKIQCDTVEIFLIHGEESEEL